VRLVQVPVLFINFKAYEQATGDNAVRLAKAAEKAASGFSGSVVLVVQAAALRLVSGSVRLPVFAQHVDPVAYGSNTGKVLPEAVKQAGAVGTVLNHAENKQSNEFVEAAVARAKSVGLEVMVCAESIERAKEIAGFEAKPDLVAVEPPELIGGDVSVSTASPELISNAVEAVKEIDSGISVVTGAGIKNASDAEKAAELGTIGVFVASGIVKADNPEEAINGLLKGLSK